jgi:hypothetical protein
MTGDRNKITLFLMTEPDTVTRAGFVPMEQPYSSVVAVDTVPHCRDGNMEIEMLPDLADRLIAYHRRYFDKTGAPTAEINCAHFTRWMMGSKAVENYLQSVIQLDRLTGSVIESRELHAGHVGIIATSQDLQDPSASITFYMQD